MSTTLEKLGRTARKMQARLTGDRCLMAIIALDEAMEGLNPQERDYVLTAWMRKEALQRDLISDMTATLESLLERGEDPEAIATFMSEASEELTTRATELRDRQHSMWGKDNDG